MLYCSTVALIQGGPASAIPTKYSEFIGKCLHMTMPNGKLDIMVLKTPPTLVEAERTVRCLYDIARKEAARQGITSHKIDVTVLLDGLDIEVNRNQTWEVVAASKFELELPKLLRSLVPDNSDIQLLPVVLLGGGINTGVSLGGTPGGLTTPMNKKYQEIEEMEQKKETDAARHGETLYSRTWEYNVIALGGTFDHLHEGHKLLLTMAGYLARECLIVGITGPELLKNKKYAQAMQSYMERKESVRNFLNYVYPSLDLDIVMINDIYGPTAQVKEIDGLVVSKETAAGGDSVNKLRSEKGWPELVIFEVGLISDSDSGDDSDKVSSTQLRKEEIEQREKREKL
ncbi:putative pantetheine-phosphate adenylyltransferase [Sugiyamaella lignohabitans]|uniref:Putative pantetheine-phosphate adenylyltransferase n=1 Tax=Sugiyamaella lignohabitans TaxID=796027 RepID=A0A167CLV4_9ASCO|nr:putative pantetheine-phosphate adenylyltransferase [Sugiyamaella lignohabitans]ANB11869.1 putative pantetheine-phosphate adenylyltransferase [Sugiyamaella lignohabitans]